MNKVSESVDCFQKGCACSQAILSVFGESFGLNRKQAMQIASGFAGGMVLGETCGAVTGAFMVLGLCFCTDACDTPDGRRKTYAKVREFSRRFEQRNKSIVCKDLLGCDISTVEGLKIAQEKDLFKTTCAKMVADAAEIIEDMIKESQKADSMD